jgi:hypothetical protein
MTLPQAVRIKTLFAILGLGLWIGSGMLYFHYAKTRPGEPDPGTGRIYAYGQAGKDFCLNAGERRLWRCLMAAGVICLAVMVGSYLYERRSGDDGAPSRS